MPQGWPERLWIVRHGQSAGNVARAAAQAARQARIDIAERDVDVPLSPLGEEQSRALGRWFGAMPDGEQPEIVFSSPYRRARHTAALIREEAGFRHGSGTMVLDERLREKEFGVLDRLTSQGIAEHYPEQAEFRRSLGKFYHRPPGGESWCDVILRLRSALDSICLRHGGRRVLIVGHQVVVLCLRYLLEGLTEEEILAIDREGDVANCGVTEYAFDPGLGLEGGMVLRHYNLTTPVEREGTRSTTQPHGGAPR
ncbi:histidine phosphatase family protein [Roseomonas marmotae]|uniref:Histidine phosphatase family protein n=1 Tax=Roseomonas marmotae TaxID=2768161 RepID=A0ABS3KAC4_9PROT|nr:histidine phosphatase family protein [Roseomonas marmotae]MBO1073311.1 histidine phosphatase family protein [Roseomonas marmotae]QTI79072.1 histidine phosphatase family protein [Roseomonas marmotae]